eukprot:UN01510
MRFHKNPGFRLRFSKDFTPDKFATTSLFRMDGVNSDGQLLCIIKFLPTPMDGRELLALPYSIIYGDFTSWEDWSRWHYVCLRMSKCT